MTVREYQSNKVYDVEDTNLTHYQHGALRSLLQLHHIATDSHLGRYIPTVHSGYTSEQCVQDQN